MIVHNPGERIEKHGRRFFECHPVLYVIEFRLRWIPFEYLSHRLKLFAGFATVTHRFRQRATISLQGR